MGLRPMWLGSPSTVRLLRALVTGALCVGGFVGLFAGFWFLFLATTQSLGHAALGGALFGGSAVCFYTCWRRLSEREGG